MSNDNFLAATELETYTGDQFINGDADVVTDVGTLASGQNLAQYTVVGRIAATGLLTAWAPAASDGSQLALGILVHSVNATAGNMPAQIYIGGEFNSSMVVWPAGTAAQQRVAFDRTNIKLRASAYSM